MGHTHYYINMKSLLIIPAYAPTVDKQEILVTCIRKLREATDEFDILVSSHGPLPEDIIRSVDFYVYDTDNRFSNGGGSIYSTELPGAVVLRFAKYTHEYPLIRLLRNGFAIAKANDYDFFYFTDFDNFYDKEDFQKVINLRNQMMEEKKKFIFFKPHSAGWIVDHIPLYNIYYDLFISGGLVNEYYEIFDQYFPKTLESYNDKLGYIKPGRPQCLEHYFYDAFRHKRHESLIVEEYVKDFVPNSEINKSGLLSTLCMILPDNNGNHYVYIANHNTEPYVFVVYMNDINVGTYALNLTTNSFTSGHLIDLKENCTIRVEVYKNDSYITTHTLTFDTENVDQYKEVGLIQR